MKKVSWVFLILVLTLSFQNCAPARFVSGSLESLKLSQNGGVYGGKPTGTYYRFVPDFTCEQKEMPSAILEITDSNVTLTENKKMQCGAVKQQMDLSQIDTSVFQNQIIGYQEGIFEGASDMPAKIPSNLVEVWCQNRNDENGIELITHFDRDQNLAVNRIYYSIPDALGGFETQLVPDFPVARIISQSTLVVKDDRGFELTVHRDQPSSQIGLFKAEMQVMIAGQKISGETSCRLGGSLDPSIWPSRQVVDMNVVDFKTSPDLSYMAYSAKTIDGIANLFSAKSDGTSHRQVAPAMLAPGILDFNISPDSKNLVYRGSQRIQDVSELYKVNLDGSGNLKLGEDLVTSTQATVWGSVTELKFTNDGSAVFYSDGAHDTNPGGTHPRLKTVPLSGGLPTVLSPVMLNSVGAYGYSISTQLKKVVFLQGSPTRPDLYSSNFDGSQILNITPVTANWISWGDNLKLSAGGRFVILKTFGAAGVRQYAVALDGSGTTEVPLNWDWILTNETETHALLEGRFSEKTPGTYVLDPSEIGILDLKTGNLVTMPTLQEPFFTKDSMNLIGTEAMPDGRLRGMLYSPVSGTRTEFCPGLSGSLMKIIEIEQGKFLIAAFETGSRILNVYTKNSSAICSKVNSAVAVGTKIDAILDISVSPDRKKILAHMGLKEVSTSGFIPKKRNQLLYIPLNGKTPAIVNFPTYDTAQISQASFLSDSQTVLYIGEQLRPGETNVFLWKASN